MTHKWNDCEKGAYVMLQTAPMPASNQFPSYFLSLISVKDRLLLQGNDCIPFFPSVIVNDT